MVLDAARRRWHGNSEFGPGPRREVGLREQFYIRLRLRELAYTRRISAKMEWVGRALLGRVGRDGQCDPAHKTLADQVGCDERTVRRALARLRELNVLRWVRRLVRDGWRTAQTSNAYVFCDGHSAREASFVLNRPKKKEKGAMSTAKTAWPPLPERSVHEQIYELQHGRPPPSWEPTPKAAPPARSVDDQLAALGFRRGEGGELIPL